MTRQRMWTVLKYAAVAAAGYYAGPTGVGALKALWRMVGG